MLRPVPLPVTYWLADRCGDLAYLLFARLRRNVAGNVAQVLGAAASARQVRRVVRQVFRASGRNVLDL